MDESLKKGYKGVMGRFQKSQMSKNIPYISLCNHSAFSLSEGALRIPELLEKARDYHQPALGITDTANVFGAMEFCLEAVKKGIQPLLGCQIFVAPKANDPRLLKEQKKKPPLRDALFLFTQNKKGYENLMYLVSQHYFQDADYPHIPFEILLKHHEGLIALSGGHKGPVNQLILAKETLCAQQIALDFKETFGDRFYFSLERLGLDPEKITEPLMLEWAYEFGIPLVATNEAFFLDQSMYNAHDALMCISSGSYVSDPERPRISRESYYKSPRDMASLFQDIPEAIHNTYLIAQRCHFILKPTKPMLPPFPTPLGEDQELTQQAKKGLQWRLESHVFKHAPSEHDTLRKKYEERLAYELKVIIHMGFSGYFLIVGDFIQWAKSNNIPVGPGRGSGAGSLVAWCLSITDIDPIHFNLLFERFLNPERVSMPDFDVDFCQERRDEVIHYVKEKYGHDHVAQIITFGKLQARAVVRDVGRVLGLPYGQVDRLSKMIPSNPANPVTLKEALKTDPELSREVKSQEETKTLMDYAIKLEGLYRHASTHAAGVVISGPPLMETVALYHDDKSPLPATQFHMKHVEMAGLVKFDFLGLKTLSVIKACEKMIQAQEKSFHINTIPLNDKKTFHLLQRIETTGVFQLESPGMRDVIKKLHPQHFEEIIALVALYRPGPMDDIPRYIACKHGDEAVTYMHPILEDILKETYGVMVYQEQVMQMAQKLAGYSLGEADMLRRAMGKKIVREMEDQRTIFLKGAENNNVSKKTAEKIFDQAAKFAGYGFNKCHATPYALLAYQTAYLKANYPLAFMAASMTFDMHNTDRLAVFHEDLHRMHVKLLPPDINASRETFVVEEEGIRYALAAIKGAGEEAMKMIVQERERQGPFKDILSFCKRLSTKVVNKRQMEKLIAAGVFDTLEPDRSLLWHNLEKLMMYALKPEKTQGQPCLFKGDLEKTPSSKGLLKPGRPWTLQEKLQHEFEAIGFYLTFHPLSEYGDLKSLGVTSIVDLKKALSTESQLFNLSGVVVSKKERVSKKGKKYAFVQFSDTSGLFEVTFFSEMYMHHKAHLEPGRLFWLKVSGHMDEDQPKLLIQDAEVLEDKWAENFPSITLEIKNKKDISSLKRLLDGQEKGPTGFFLKIPTKGKAIAVLKLKETLKLTPTLYQALEQYRLQER